MGGKKGKSDLYVLLSSPAGVITKEVKLLCIKSLGTGNFFLLVSIMQFVQEAGEVTLRSDFCLPRQRECVESLMVYVHTLPSPSPLHLSAEKKKLVYMVGGHDMGGCSEGEGKRSEEEEEEEEEEACDVPAKDQGQHDRMYEGGGGATARDCVKNLKD